MTSELNVERQRLTELLRSKPPSTWSLHLLKAVSSVLEMYFAESLQERPAAVLQLVLRESQR